MLLWVLHLSMAVMLCGGVLTHFHEREGIIHLREGETTHEFLEETSGDAFVPVSLPFYLRLDKFGIDSLDDSARDYWSKVYVTDAHGTESSVISMNRPLFKAGYRIIQASYDEDLAGTHLAVIHDPWGTGIAVLGFVMFLLSAIGMLGQRLFTRSVGHTKVAAFSRHKILLGTVALVLVVLPLTPLFLAPLQPILRIPLLFIHVGTVILSYVLLVLSFQKRHLLMPAVLLLGIGIVLGALWGSISWGTYWSWDPKETWALVTLVLYAVPLHRRFLPKSFGSRCYLIYNVLCLMTLLMTYLGVNFFMESQHSYL